MLVVLNEDIKTLGYKGEIIKVKDGYFRNYLWPKGLADAATKSRLKVAENRKERIVMKKRQILDNAKDVLKKLKGIKLSFKVKATSKGKLYGALVEHDILDALEKEAKVKLEKDFIKMDHIKEIGSHKVIVHLGKDLEEGIEVVVEEAK